MPSHHRKPPNPASEIRRVTSEVLTDEQEIAMKTID